MKKLKKFATTVRRSRPIAAEKLTVETNWAATATATSTAIATRARFHPAAHPGARPAVCAVVDAENRAMGAR
ncbi:hypothetical protein MTES_1448 [Microbacterium testaceum StLB037]|uniref:Uncharacterized protein n=1 Tax=Microbacterium testaceum (strain StLB037) TaxID=979556 RepID=E8N8G7_MICTS|nr:hypothetical protein MTES_1448 [Microbacterium testaceum StLB037]